MEITSHYTHVLIGNSVQLQPITQTINELWKETIAFIQEGFWNKQDTNFGFDWINSGLNWEYSNPNSIHI